MKLIDAKKDHYRKLAHEQGYRSRASYKLKEINKSYRIIGPGSYVLDLGCAPGGWSQVAHQIAGNQGKVLGIDLSFVEELPGVEIIRGDIEDPDILEQIMSFFNRKVDSVICDLCITRFPSESTMTSVLLYCRYSQKTKSYVHPRGYNKHCGCTN